MFRFWHSRSLTNEDRVYIALTFLAVCYLGVVLSPALWHHFTTH